MNLAFPLCRERRHEDRVRDALGACVHLVTERVPAADLVAVVLTGSFARGEGSVLATDGALRILGDLEFFVVLAPRAAGGQARRTMARWGHDATRRLASLGVRSEVEFGPIGADFFHRHARPSIFVYDLRQHGKVLWGRGDVLERIAPFGPDRIPRDDAVYLLFNRIVEQLDAHERLARVPASRLLDAAYQQTKLTLDVAGSVLAFTGRHTPLYQRRAAEFARLVTETPSLHARLGEHFLAAVAEAAAAKLEPAEHFPARRRKSVDDERERLRQAIAGAVPVVTGVLTWELQQLMNSDEGLEGLLRRWLARPTARQRLWDWAKFTLNPLPAPLPISHIRSAALFFRSTPRALLYAAAALAYAGLATPPVDLAPVARLLPLPRAAHPRDAAQQRLAIVALWRWCVRNS